MTERDRTPSPKETVRLIDRLQSLLDQRNIDAEILRLLHHSGDSIAGFQCYCEGIKNFRPGGNNHWMYMRLQFIYDDLSVAGQEKTASLPALVAEATQRYPFVEKQKNGWDR